VRELGSWSRAYCARSAASLGEQPRAGGTALYAAQIPPSVAEDLRVRWIDINSQYGWHAFTLEGLRELFAKGLSWDQISAVLHSLEVYNVIDACRCAKSSTIPQLTVNIICKQLTVYGLYT
jgi:hypothetical protein